MNFKNDLLSCTIIHAQHLFQPFMLVMYSIMVTGLVYDSCLFMHSKQIFQGFHLSVHICLRSATTNKTDGCCIFSGKGWCWAVFTAGCGYRHETAFERACCYCRTSTEMFLCQGSSSDSGFALFLPSSPFLSLRHAQLHQVPRGSNGDFGRSGVVRMPGGRWAQASHYLDEKGKESQLPALWGTTRELPVWSVWMCNTSLSHTFTAHYLSAFVWYRAAGHTLSFYRTYATCRSRRCVCI